MRGVVPKRRCWKRCVRASLALRKTLIRSNPSTVNNCILYEYLALKERCFAIRTFNIILTLGCTMGISLVERLVLTMLECILGLNRH